MGSIVREILSSKIHKARVTSSKVDYDGSITIDSELMKKCGLWENQKVLVVSNTSGNRLETYAMLGKRGEIQMNGAAARKIQKDEEITIMGFCFSETPKKPICILLNKKNELVKTF